MSRPLPRNEDESLDVIADQLIRLVEIAEQKKAIVPLFIFIPAAEMREDQLERLTRHMRYEFERNGLIEPEAPDLHDV